jgi:hypothetical protein
MDPTMGFPSSAGPVVGYGYWMQPDANHCYDFFFQATGWQHADRIANG